MANGEIKKFNFDRKNYFPRFLADENLSQSIDEQEKSNTSLNPTTKNIRHALEYFVDDLRQHRDQTIQRFLSEQTVNEIFRAIARLLLSNEDRICGNSAYIMGSVVELEAGLKRFLTVFTNDRTTNNVDVIRILCHLLTHADTECVLNAAGTLGTICSSKEGRDMIVQHSCIAQLITNTSALLSSKNSWIASNAALVLARITVEEIGCQTILTHPKHKDIISQLLSALDINDISRSTNAAFAIGRLIEGDQGKKTLISDCGQYQIFDALVLMLEVTEDKGVNKNACYALSCLCTTPYGFQLCLQYLTIFRRILVAVETILSSMEHETVWFALMSLRTIAQYDGASEHLCYSKNLPEKLKQIQAKWNKCKDIQDEAKLLWYMIHRNIKPNRPKVDDCQNSSAHVSWDLTEYSWNENDQIQYRIILDNVAINVTNRTQFALKDLKPNTIYHVQIQYVTSHGDSIRSDPTIFRTDDELPPPINNLHLVRATMTAARIAWDLPDLSGCNSFKGYQIYLDEVEYECTTECGITISSLTVKTAYQIDVCVVSNKGKGPRTILNITTASAGDSVPAPPTFSAIGRREMHIKWQPPDVIIGRLTRYELLCNRRAIYSGTDQEYHATMLKSDTEYTMEVIVITNEGRFRSRPAKARTLKDEYSNAQRPSLYEPSPQNVSKVKRTEAVQTIHSAGTTNTTPKVSLSKAQRISKEVTAPHRHIEITTVQTLQFKSGNTSNSRSVTGMLKNLPLRSVGTASTRTTQRSRFDPTRIAASVIVPTLATDRNAQVRWAQPVTQREMQSNSFRFVAPAKPPTIANGVKTIERVASTSLPDLPSNTQRTHSWTQS